MFKIVLLIYESVTVVKFAKFNFPAVKYPYNVVTFEFIVVYPFNLEIDIVPSSILLSTIYYNVVPSCNNIYFGFVTPSK